MSTVNQDELKAIKVLKFTGKESEWDCWSETFVALARARGFAGILIQFPPEMDKNCVRYGLAKLGQISKLPNWQKIVVLCVHNTTSALNS